MNVRRLWYRLWLPIRYNPIAEWHFERRMAKGGWRVHAGWITRDAMSGLGLWALLTGVGCDQDLSEYDDGLTERQRRRWDRKNPYDVGERIRWATCAIGDLDLLDEALAISEGFVGRDRAELPELLRKDGFVPERAVLVLSAAKERHAILEQ